MSRRLVMGVGIQGGTELRSKVGFSNLREMLVVFDFCYGRCGEMRYGGIVFLNYFE